MSPQEEPSAAESPQDEERDDAVIGAALRWSLLVMGGLGLIGAAIVTWNLRAVPAAPVQQTPLALPEVRAKLPVAAPRIPFTDITAAAGITFRHENGAAGEKLLPETMGGGCAFLDFDNDGRPDILLINSCRWPWDTRPQPAPPTMALYRNQGDGKFTDVTAGSGLDVTFYGMGVATGDYDNDGRVDLFISALGPNHLFRNLGDGRFEDVTAQAGVAGADDQWSTSCGWLDYDRDGDLDLFVCNYLRWSREFDLAQNFQLIGGGRGYGRPQVFPGTFPYLYRNDGAGRFTDVTAQAGLQIRNPATDVPAAKSLGIGIADFDDDGWLDLLVANDTVQNLLFHNQRDGTFQEIGALAGVAFDNSGNARGAMGIDIARFRNSDETGIAIGNFSNEMSALYVAHGNSMQFTDEAIPSGLGPPTRLELTFGVFFFDADLDGRLDLFSANGHLEEDINKVQPSQFYEQPPRLFWNCGAEQATEFIPLTEAECGPDFFRRMVGRGAACADIDLDGDLDVLITASGQPPRLLRNDQQLHHHWLRLSLTGKKCNRDAIGSVIEIPLEGKTLRRVVMPTRSYLSQCELPVSIGLGEAGRVEKITIHWADGAHQEVLDPPVDQPMRIEQK